MDVNLHPVLSMKPSAAFPNPASPVSGGRGFDQTEAVSAGRVRLEEPIHKPNLSEGRSQAADMVESRNHRQSAQTLSQPKLKSYPKP